MGLEELWRDAEVYLWPPYQRFDGQRGFIFIDLGNCWECDCSLVVGRSDSCLVCGVDLCTPCFPLHHCEIMGG